MGILTRTWIVAEQQVVIRRKFLITPLSPFDPLPFRGLEAYPPPTTTAHYRRTIDTNTWWSPLEGVSP
jgi:hypothetical protein